MQEMVPINILIGDRSYRIKISPSDEEAVRKVTSIINNKILEFKTQFAGKDMQDYIAMVLIWYATQQPDHSAREIMEQEIESKLQSFEKTIDKALSS
jgi:cell division protein ZapA (FtsZ GTPase activity inhibitor)